MNGTMEQADLPVLVKPGTDGALACAVMHCLFRDGKADWAYLDQYTDAPARARGARAHARAGLGLAHHRLPGRDHRGVRPAGRLDQARLFPARLRLLALAQRAGQHARGKLHPGGDRRLAARGRRRVPQQRRHLSLEQVDDRRPRRARQVGAHARPVARRRDPHRRRGCAQGRPAGRRDADPEHQPGVGVPGPGDRSSAALPARTCSPACTSSS